MKHCTFLLLLACTFAAHAKNVDLSTVPKRDAVQLTTDNGGDLTPVRETRTVTFRRA
jgi:hypothetical protein